MIPSQTKPMAVRAVVHLKNGLKYMTNPLNGLIFDSSREKVELYKCSEMPIPFWSRASKINQATINLPKDISGIKQVWLIVKIWDGGEGTIKEPFRINGVPYRITSEKAIHDVVFTTTEVSPTNLVGGENEIALLSDTQHHGIEICLPGPVLIIRYR